MIGLGLGLGSVATGRRSSTPPSLPFAAVLLTTGDSQDVGTANDETAERAAYTPSSRIKVRNLAGQWVTWDPNGVTGLSFAANKNKINAAIGYIEQWKATFPNDDLYIISDGFSGSFQGRSPVVATVTASIAGNILTRTAGGALTGDHLVTDAGATVPLGTKTLFQATDANNYYIGKTGQTTNVNYTVASTSMDLRNGYLTWAVDESTAYLGQGQTLNGVRKRVVDGIASLAALGLTPRIVTHIHTLGTNDKSTTASADAYGAALDAFLTRRNSDWPMSNAITVMARVGPDADAASLTVRAAQLARQSATFRLVDSDSWTRWDGTHWTIGNGLRDYGRRAFEATWNYIQYGDFASGIAWTASSANVAVTGGKATVATGPLAGTESFSQTSPITLTAGTYRIAYTLSGRTAGGVRARIGGTYGAVRTANATQSQDLVVASVTDQLIVVEFAAGTNTNASVDDLTITKIA